MDPTPRRRPRAITVVAAGLAAFALPTLADGALADEHDALITRADLDDRIRGGMLGQILGNLNG
ncbi:MAG TPA: hypothetical protein PJ982_16810, partial [Lacipirellulaceae bacterium]|nr:hypothetical protein [Lacipirellulaceae bacterium]